MSFHFLRSYKKLAQAVIAQAILDAQRGEEDLPSSLSLWEWHEAIEFCKFTDPMSIFWCRLAEMDPLSLKKTLEKRFQR